MTTITQLMQDIKAKVKAAPLLEGRAGTTVGAKAGDPTMRKAKMPCAWIIYVGNQTRSATSGTRVTSITHEVVVKILVPYEKEADMEMISWPTLEQVTQYVTGSPIASIPGACTRWTYMGMSMEELDDRLVYEQRYQVQGNV